MSEYAAGTPSWVELSTADADGSYAFYNALFGWTATEAMEAFGGYRTFLDDGRSIGGLNPMGEQPVWTTYVATDDADATAEKVAGNGGTVIAPPMDVGDLGRMAVFLDPAGAVFGVWQAGEMRGADKVNAPVSCCWNELHTGDREAAQAFYTAVFGWGAADEDMGGEPYTVFGVGGRPVAGAGGASETQPHWLTWFAVADTDDAVARAQELGAALGFGPFDIPTVGRCAGLVDPQGAVFGVLQGETADE
jgi:predicted enzyme related to lactoylglutathione lyase